MRILSFVLLAGATWSASPLAAQTIEPHQARPVEPYQGRSIETHQARPIEPYHAAEVKPIGPAGVDLVASPAPLDPALVGRWSLAIPGVAYQTETDRGAYTERRLHAGAGAGFGVLTVAADGGFVWRRPGGLARGRLEQVQPRRDAVSGRTYWRLVSGREQFYLTSDPKGGIEMYGVGTNMIVARGSRSR